MTKFPSIILLLLFVGPGTILYKLRSPSNANVRSLQYDVSLQNDVAPSMVVDGDDASLDRFPYFVELWKEEKGGFKCGGTLIAPNIVLTAAHCLGSLNFAVIGKKEVIPVKKNYIHPKYRGFGYDQLLLELEEPSSAKPVRVNFDSNVPRDDDEKITVIGYGWTNYQGGFPNNLQEGSFEFVPNDDCSKSFKQLSLSDDMLCISDKSQSPCRGDSGGPLLILGNSPEEDVQVATVSWGIGCDSSEAPAVGIRTSAALDFIVGTACSIASNGLCGDLAHLVTFRDETLHEANEPSEIPSDQPSMLPSEEPTSTPSSA